MFKLVFNVIKKNYGILSGDRINDSFREIDRLLFLFYK